jgi:uncharacterized protein (DUF58 family)
MLESGGRLLLALGLGLCAAGLLLPLPGAVLAGVALLSLVHGGVARLRSGLREGKHPWDLAADLRVDRPMDDAEPGGRSHRVDQLVRLRLKLSAPPERLGTHIRIERWRTSAGLDVTEPGAPRIELRDGGGTTRVEVVPRSAAVHKVIGVLARIEDALGLVGAPVFLPCPCELAVLPRSLPLDLKSVAETRRHSPRVAGGQRPDRAVGPGDDLRELREHQPGDPFKHVAWKATAARGELMTRLFERDQTRAMYVVLDTGATMRDGRPGHGPLDQAMDLVHSLAEACARTHDPFGLALVDGRVVDRRPVLEGLLSLRDVDRALLELRRAVAEDLSPLDDGELIDTVARHLVAVERLRLPPSGPEPELQRRWRERVVMMALARLPERERVPLLRGPEPSSRPEFAILRRFCRAADLALPYRQPLPAAQRVEGLRAGVQAALSARKGPFAVVIASDFRRLAGACQPLWQACSRARSAGHRVLAVAVRELDERDVYDLVKSPDDFDTARGLVRADAAARQGLLDELQEGARGHGVAFVADPNPAELVALWRGR